MSVQQVEFSMGDAMEVSPPFSVSPSYNIDEAEAWPGWSEENKKTLNDFYWYSLEILSQINKAWLKGPLDKENRIKKPKGNLNSIIFNLEKAKKNDVDFNSYLKKKLIKEGEIINADQQAMPTNDLSAMAEYLNLKYKVAMRKNNDSLIAKLDLGRDLKKAKKIIAGKKIEGKKIKWCEWLLANTIIGKSQSNNYILMHNLVKKYPKLRQLNITFTKLLNLKKNICEVFENADIGNQWK